MRYAQAAVILLFLLLTACGGGGGSAPDAPDTPVAAPDAPKVTQTSPRPGEIVLADTKALFVQFDRELDPDSLDTSSVRVVSERGERLLAALRHDIQGKRLTVVPIGEMDRDTAHEMIVAAGILPAGGGSPTVETRVAFRTGRAEPQEQVPLRASRSSSLLSVKVASDGVGAILRHERFSLAAETLDLLHFREPGAEPVPERIRAGVRVQTAGDRGLALADGGQAVVAWRERAGDQFDAFVRRFDPGTGTWEPRAELERETFLEATVPQVVASEGGGLLAVWVDAFQDRTFAKARVFDPALGGWLPQRTVDPGSSRAAGIRAGMSPAGHALVAWTRATDEGVEVRARLRTAGQDFEPEPQLLDAPLGATVFIDEVVLLPDGSGHVVWRETDLPGDVRGETLLRRARLLGTNLGRSVWEEAKTIFIHANALQEARVGAALDGSFAAACVGAEGLGASVFAVTVSAAGVTSVARRLDGTQDQVVGGLRADARDDGTFALAWLRVSIGGGLQRFHGALYSPADGQWSTTDFETVRGAASPRPIDVAIEPSGAATFYWIRPLEANPASPEMDGLRRATIRPGILPTGVDAMGASVPEKYGLRVALDRRGLGLVGWVEQIDGPLFDTVYAPVR